MKTSVTIGLKSDFITEVEEFVKQLNLYLDQKGEMPSTNTDAIKRKYINLSTDDMIKSGTLRNVAKRVSKSCFDELLEKSLEAA